MAIKKVKTTPRLMADRWRIDLRVSRCRRRTYLPPAPFTSDLLDRSKAQGWTGLPVQRRDRVPRQNFPSGA